MRTLIITDLKKIVSETTTGRVNVVESEEQLTSDNDMYIVDESNAAIVMNDIDRIHIPSTVFEKVQKNIYVYFELDNYPFFQKIKDAISGKAGVLSFKRTTGQLEQDRLIASDLIVLSELLREPQQVKVKCSNPALKPNHVIITVNFGGGTMAHLEYSFSDSEEKIEFEWSGVKQIIEFDSEEMKPLIQTTSTSLPLAYTAGAIIKNSRKATPELEEKLRKYVQFIAGGAKQ